MNIDLSQRRALVCGASEGIGRAVAQQLANSGASISLVARRSGALEEVRAGLSGVGHHVIVADLDHPESVGQIVGQHLEQVGPIDIVINNAGGPPGGPLEAAQAADFQKALNRLLLSGHSIIQQCLPYMKARGWGRIINIISTSVRQPIDNLGVSNTLRAATAAWAKTWSKELAPFGITMNSVLPGATETSRLRDIVERSVQKSGLSSEEVRASMLKEIPAGRFAQPEEIAFAVAYLASEQAAYINGIHISVDGGRTKSLL